MVEKRKSYIRVGTQYYKIVNAPSISGVENEALVPWNIETIRQDHGKTFLAAFRNMMASPVSRTI
jgi:hypothetical protein